MSRHCKNSNPKSAISRRDFLRLAGVGAASLFVGSCQSQSPTSSPVAEPTGNISAQVAVSQARTYDRETIEKQVFEMIDGLGGLGDVVKSGDSVAIKTNLTGLTFALLLSVVIGWLWPVFSPNAEILARTDVGFDGVVLALASGAAAVLSLTSGVASALVGVMVAVALLPPTATLGMVLASGQLLAEREAT